MKTDQRNKTSDIILGVPFCSQYDKENGLKEEWKGKSCGVLSLKMIMEYYLDDEVDTQELLERALNLGGMDEHQNWYHSSLVKAAIDYGFVSWRRSWIPSKKDVNHFKNEGVNETSLEAWRRQLQAESLPVTVDEIESGHPVIVSAPPYFTVKEKAHLLVLNGIKYDKADIEGFYYLDPYNRVNDNAQGYVPFEDFIETWTYRAIFVRPKTDE